MADLINFDLPKDQSSIIKVIGVGGGGGNAINHMFKQGIADVDFVLCNTDAQALQNSPVPVKIQLGESLTQGRGAGNKPEQGREAAIESLDTITELLSHNTKMIFITAGMGGGTGTGAAPVIAQEAKELGILTVAIVTIPFRFEGNRRINQALEGIEELREHVDSLLVINNEKLREIYGDLKISEAFSRADNILTIAAKGIAEIITVHGNLNVDFADVQTVMKDSGVAIMGSALASGENRALNAIEEALNSPLLNDNDILGATNILLNITSGSDEVTMDEIGQITDYVQDRAGQTADIIWGNGCDENLNENVNVTIIATGFDTSSIPELMIKKEQQKKVVYLDDQMERNVDADNQYENNKSKNSSKEISVDPNQRVIEFNCNESEDNSVEKFSLDGNKIEECDFVEEEKEEFEIFKNTEKAEERSERLKETHEKLKDLSFKLRKSGDIEDLENEPAYKRSKIELDNRILSEDENSDISRFILSEDEEDNPRINLDNSYLYDNVD